MDENEIKKALYKEKPTAYLKSNDDGYEYYSTIESMNLLVRFNIPVSDMGTSIHRFKAQMPAHELIRWLKTENN